LTKLKTLHPKKYLKVGLSLNKKKNLFPTVIVFIHKYIALFVSVCSNLKLSTFKKQKKNKNEKRENKNETWNKKRKEKKRSE